MWCNIKEKLCSFFSLFFLFRNVAAAASFARSFVWRIRSSDIALRRDLRQLEFPSSADLLMRGNWPIYQNHEETELQSRRCIKNGSTGPESGKARGTQEEGEREEKEMEEKEEKVEEEQETRKSSSYLHG